MGAKGGGESCDSSPNLGCTPKKMTENGDQRVLRQRKKNVFFIIKADLKKRVGVLGSWSDGRGQSLLSHSFTTISCVWGTLDVVMGLVYAILLYSQCFSMHTQKQRCMPFLKLTEFRMISSTYICLCLSAYILDMRKLSAYRSF